MPPLLLSRSKYTFYLTPLSQISCRGFFGQVMYVVCTSTGFVARDHTTLAGIDGGHDASLEDFPQASFA